MTPGALRRLRKVLRLGGVATQAAFTLCRQSLLVTAVALRAILVLVDRVQRGQARRRVARGAGGWGSDAVGPVGTVTVLAAALDTSVHGARLGLVTLLTGRGREHVRRVRLVTLSARLMTLRCCGVFALVARSTGLDHDA